MIDATSPMRPDSPRQSHRSLRRAVAPVAVLVGALVFGVGAAQAALPPKGAKFAFHDHETAGKNWHVELRIDSKSSKKIASLVVYSQQCKGTVAKTGVAISDAGVIAAAGGLKGYGWWEVNATFSDPTTLAGTMRMQRANCDTGFLSFPNAITGDGHTGHSHGAGHNHGQQYADFTKASPKQRAQAVALHKRVLKKWTGMTATKAKRLGFHRPAGSKPMVGYMFHMYNRRYERDKRIFDGRRPESLVFWRRPEGGEPVILGPMFRVPAGKRPRFAGPIPIYHGHADSTGKIPNQMTHVWMTKDPTLAWANCLPVAQLQEYNPAFKWVQDTQRQHIGAPCK